MRHRHTLYSNMDRFGKLIVDVVSTVFDRNGKTSLATSNHGDRLTGVAAKGKEECIQFLIVGDDALNDILLSKLRIGQVHRYTSFRYEVSTS